MGCRSACDVFGLWVVVFGLQLDANSKLNAKSLPSIKDLKLHNKGHATQQKPQTYNQKSTTTKIQNQRPITKTIKKTDQKPKTNNPKPMKIFSFLITLLLLCACKGVPHTDFYSDDAPVGPDFDADSALQYCAAQCAFGPRTMNTNAHERCAAWIIDRFESHGCVVTTQKADLKGWDGTMLHSTNIIASTDTAATRRIIICAHWDSRPWADNDPDSTNWRKPVMAANDGASGVAVMLEVARCIQAVADSMRLNYGIDFVCFDAEDYGAPDWSGLTDTEDTWALGAQHFADIYAANPESVRYSFGILLDMVGGQGAHFYHEGLSRHYAPHILELMWKAAQQAGYSSLFLNQDGGTVTDDHKPLNEAGIPTIDIIAYYPDCEQSGFGPTWHTVNDDMNHIDKNTLKAVGQSLIQFLYTCGDAAQ